LSLCGGLVREGSLYRFLAENRRRLFPDEMFADLFGGRGRPSVPGSVIAVVMVLQALEGCSDREAVERLRCDVRWKAAAGLAIDDAGFDASVLVLWRMRLRGSSRPERIFDAVRAVAAECGALSNKARRALDSTVLCDAVATQDTVTMIASQIRRVRKLAPAAAAAALARDYDGRAKPSCDWSDPDERAWLIDDLVSDACAVLDALDGAGLDGEQAKAAELLATVAGQDTEPDPKVPGRVRIARRVAPGRVISVVDPEARHARKTRSVRRDGYKAHIVAEPDTGIITAAELTTADTADAATGARLLQQDPTAPHNNTHNTDTAQSDTADTDTAQVDPARPPGRPPCLDRPGLRCLRRVEPVALPAAGMGRRASGLRSNVVT
ncbi:MAG: transposase, partial [bacterium]|nr:transposase [bacterium]